MKLTFSNKNRKFTGTLKQRTDEYFSSKNLHSTGNKKLYIKTAILLMLAVSTYLVLILSAIPVWLSLTLCILLGFNLAAIGFNVMHDGAHGSYSSKKWVNEIMAYSLNLMGGCTYLWRVKHNINHHTFTNIDEHDEDIDIRPLMRTHESQKKRWFHKYQHIYWVLLYGLSYVSFVYGKNFKEYFSGKIAGGNMKKMNLKEHFIFWISKITYFCIFIIIPILTLGLAKALIGYIILSWVCGFVLGIIFQLAHVVEDCDFPIPTQGIKEGSKKINEEWTIHQLATTANFSTKSKIISWFVGGLNFQVEHHLFPRVSHIHYPELSKIVKEVCLQFNIRYNEYPTLLSAVRSHVRYLKVVGIN